MDSTMSTTATRVNHSPPATKNTSPMMSRGTTTQKARDNWVRGR